MEQVGGPPVPVRIGQYYQTPRPHPWRPTLGYENVEVTPLPSQPVTNALIDPCYTPHGMATEPLKFPNLVTGFERNPAHAARAALYTRYTPIEWTHNNLRNYGESDTNRNYSERLRGEFIRVMRETDEKTAQGQREVGRRLGERITDLTFWRNEARTELERLLTESDLLQEARRSLEKAISDIEGPLHIAQECLYQRENRQGIDLVHDNAEHSLLKEIEIYRNSQEQLKCLYERIKDQLRNNRAAQHELETDVRSKEGALGIDNMCHQLNNFSKGINYYGGIEKYDPTVSTVQTWAENSNRIVQRSQSERGKSAQLRSDIENLINTVATQIWDAWSNTNNALARRAAETLEAKSKLQMHLHKIQQEIFDVEKNIELIKKAIMDKSNPMKVAHTRLEARTHRKNVELCRDTAQDRLVREVVDIQDSIEYLHRKLQEAEAQHQQLLKTRSNLESDLHNKVNSLFIDREKCMGMRRSFPITATIKY
ncbi:tektin-3 isoform X2 [Tribolium castaneum]|nr:PREDICTED: tektin-3 isoform X3 [Tribolium castaneum]XP_015832963.1 PREDICTED: tektin-3 isoform X3 [Tribolium castaneum]XP_015832964.1 PREDICTED: tektin-3 isoform X3 [Tribolium castaneum]|eukprot:XP_015832962.1 PREDICTED: tektin-3 isoform X3 [Tribolium castaneum]